MKRLNPSDGRPLSPPPPKKKVISGTTGKAVASFFTKASEKPPEKLHWRTLHDSLLIGRYDASDEDPDDVNVSSSKRRKVAAFDFDSTLIKTSSGTVFGRSAEDWQWWHASVPKKLRELHGEGFQVIIISNQAGISLKAGLKKGSLKNGGDGKRLSDFKTKVAYVLAQLNLPVTIYAATDKDGYRKPRTGMWTQIIQDYGLYGENEVILKESVFVGDAAGRLDGANGVRADHSCSDRDFAANVGLGFQTPEEYFLNEAPRPFQRSIDPLILAQAQQSHIVANNNTVKPVFEKKHSLELVLLCGSPGAGKSTFYAQTLKPLGYERVNQDILKTRDKCLKVAAEHLQSQASVVVDNTNADPDTRKHWIDLAKKHSIPIRVVYLSTPPAVCRHNDAVRAAHEAKLLAQDIGNQKNLLNGDTKTASQDLSALFNPEHRTILPSMAFTSFQSRFSEPRMEEGFTEVIKIPFEFRGSDEARSIWGKYWI